MKVDARELSDFELEAVCGGKLGSGIGPQILINRPATPAANSPN